eukprot:971285_1
MMIVFWVALILSGFKPDYASATFRRVPVPHPNFVTCSFIKLNGRAPSQNSKFRFRSFHTNSEDMCHQQCCIIPNCATASIVKDGNGDKVCSLYNRQMKLRPTALGVTFQADIRRYSGCKCQTFAQICLSDTKQCIGQFNSTVPDIPIANGVHLLRASLMGLELMQSTSELLQ